MSRPKLTEEQQAAAASRAPLLFIEANPGSGKTTVAAERYGVLRFGAGVRVQPVTGVSFTRSATRELHQRVQERWGSGSLAWPHGVITLDALVCSIVHHLLRLGVIQWPGGHTDLEVLDDWRGHKGYRWLSEKNYRRVVVLEPSGVVSTKGVRVTTAQAGFGSKKDFDDHLVLGRCTHVEVRKVLADALRVPEVRPIVKSFISWACADLLVDEIFDANRLDLSLVGLACEAHRGVTLIGDPWQALYGFRGAQPQLVPRLTAKYGFEALPLSESFRFETEEMRSLAADLRAGSPVTIPPGHQGNEEVVLASKWDVLWDAPNHVLPLSFGAIHNKTDAAAIVLLDHLLRSQLSRHAIFLPEALVLLELDPDKYRANGPEVLGGVLDLLANGDAGSVAKALAKLREAMKQLGAPRKPPAPRGNSERRLLKRLRNLSLRLRMDRELIPGMTIHQAKGMEWNEVGVRLSPAQIKRLSAGLSQAEEGDRGMYVALTRARRSVTLLG